MVLPRRGASERCFHLLVSSGLFTLSGLLVYIQYCSQAMEEFKQTVSPEKLANVDVSYGWSLAMAWLAYCLEVASGLLLMLAARITQMKRHCDSGMAMPVGPCVFRPLSSSMLMA